MLSVAYHEKYSEYDLGEGHPFLKDKPKETLKFLKEKGIELKILTPEIVEEEIILKVHSKKYLERVKKLSKDGGFLSLDTPVKKGIYDIARLSVGGTILISEEEDNYGVNLLGGFHHAGKNHSSGFCFLNDIAIAIEFLKERNKAKKFLVIDTDVHHGNGTQEIFYDRNDILKISIHQDGRTLYPGTGFINEIGEGIGRGYNINIPLPPLTCTKEYIFAFEEIVPKIAEQFSPEIIFWQSGVDTHHSDPLANLQLTLDAYYILGKKVKEITEKTAKKLVICLGGGYNPKICAKAYYNIISPFVNGGEEKEEEINGWNFNEIRQIVKRVKKELEEYWDLD